MTPPELRIYDPQLRRLYDYWREKRGERIAPSRVDIRPDEIRDLLQHIYIIEAVGTPRRFRFRLAGTTIVSEYGGRITGKFADEIDLDHVGQRILAEYETGVDRGEPIASLWHFTKLDGRELRYEHLILPLSSDGKTIDMLLAAAIGKGI